METIEILLITIIDFFAFLLGLALGRLVWVKRQEQKRKNSVRKNNDWLTLLNYTPGEPTEKAAVLNKLNKKGEKNGRKNRNHTR